MCSLCVWPLATSAEGLPALVRVPPQVIGTLPLLVNPASLGGAAAAPALPLHGLQVQTVAPQLLFNAQGQIVATLGNGAAAVATSAAVPPKAAAPAALSKPSAQVGRRLPVSQSCVLQPVGVSSSALHLCSLWFHLQLHLRSSSPRSRLS